MSTANNTSPADASTYHHSNSDSQINLGANFHLGTVIDDAEPDSPPPSYDDVYNQTHPAMVLTGTDGEASTNIATSSIAAYSSNPAPVGPGNAVYPPLATTAPQHSLAYPPNHDVNSASSPLYPLQQPNAPYPAYSSGPPITNQPYGSFVTSSTNLLQSGTANPDQPPPYTPVDTMAGTPQSYTPLDAAFMNFHEASSLDTTDPEIYLFDTACLRSCQQACCCPADRNTARYRLHTALRRKFKYCVCSRFNTWGSLFLKPLVICLPGAFATDVVLITTAIILMLAILLLGAGGR